MEKRTSAFARLVAALALVAAVLVVVVIVGAAMNDESSPREQRSERPAKKQKQERPKAETYTIQSGDTLTAISQETDVPVSRILELNPSVDPQILIAGETLKLR
ncbi:MAG TPA: LysM domain-containing protein [Solirubrobacterales bacterium]|nr:LysM domain-containing protein [Solirubrobacterales bacterium]